MTALIEPLEMLAAQEDESHYYTLEEFYNWLRTEGDPDLLYELINGVIVEKDKSDSSGPSGRHGKIMSKLSYFLNAYALPNDSGSVYTDAPFLIRNDKLALQTEGGKKNRKDNYLTPDVGFVKAGRIPDIFDGPVPAIPDMVAEINSPSDTLERISDKIQIYKDAGVCLIWSIFMHDKYAVIFRAGSDDITLLNREDEFDGENVLPGFKLKVATLFK